MVITEEASVLDKTKYSFCQTIANYQKERNLSKEELADLLGLDENVVTKLLKNNIEIFALDSLISYVEKLHLPLQVKIINKASNYPH